MYLDPNSWQAQSIADQIIAILGDKRELELIQILQPQFSQDGNQYCYLYGEMPNDYIAGFGDTAILAARDFFNNFYNQKVATQVK